MIYALSSVIDLAIVRSCRKKATVKLLKLYAINRLLIYYKQVIRNYCLQHNFQLSDRHLRFTPEPSHIWAFGWGIGVGILVTIVRSALQSLSTNTNHLEKLSPTPENTSREGLRTELTSSFPFGID